MRTWYPVCACGVTYHGRAFTDREVADTAVHELAHRPMRCRCGKTIDPLKVKRWEEENEYVARLPPPLTPVPPKAVNGGMKDPADPGRHRQRA